MAVRNFITILIWIIFAPGNIQHAFSQTKELDSLKYIFSKEREDTNKVNIALSICNEYYKNYDFTNILKYADTALTIAKRIKFPMGAFNSYSHLAYTHSLKGNFTEAIKYYKIALVLAREIGDKEIIALTHLSILEAHKYNEDFPEAFKNAFIALGLFEEIGDKYKIAQTWSAIARVYLFQDNIQETEINHAEANRYFTKALAYYEKSQDTQQQDLAVCYHSLGRVNLLQKNYPEAMKLFLAALKIWKETGNKTYTAGTTTQIGFLNRDLGKAADAKGNNKEAILFYKKALANYLNALSIWEELNNTTNIASIKGYIGDIYILLKQFPDARRQLEKALELVKLGNTKSAYKDIYRILYTLDSTQGNFKLALENYKQYITYKDSITNEAFAKKGEKYKMQYEFDKKEDSLNQKQIITETKLKTETKQKYIYWVGLTLLALLSFFIFLNFRNQKKINRLAAEAHVNEKTELELQSLRAQLNPHFIFNCINSIDAFIHNHDKYNATLYLNKFAKLLRNILDSSKQNTITFTKDIETLKLYIELEELRNENKFKTIIEIDKELIDSDYKVPPLIIQPFVENAILHGLKNKDGNDGLLEIEIKKTGDNIEYCIKDNGIGRKAAGLIAQNKESSYGVHLSYDRIRLFNKEKEASVIITDLYENNLAKGTLIKAKLKII